MCIVNNKNNEIHAQNGKSKYNQSNGCTQSNKSTMFFPRVRRFLPIITSGYIFNTIFYFMVYFLLPYTGLNTTPVAEFCKNDSSSCTRRDLFAFQIVSLINLAYLGLLGFYTFFISRRVFTAVPKTPQGRILGNVQSKGVVDVMLPEADFVNVGIIVFQGWDIIASIFFEEHCTAIMMTHHFLAFICGLFSLEYGVVPFYATYFGGVSEFSSIFLAIVDLFRYFPPSSFQALPASISTLLATVELGCQGMFALTFFIFRILGWIYVSGMLLRDARYILNHGMIKQHCPRPGSTLFLWYLMSMTVLLGGLQMFWFGKIVEKVLEVVSGN